MVAFAKGELPDGDGTSRLVVVGMMDVDEAWKLRDALSAAMGWAPPNVDAALTTEMLVRLDEALAAAEAVAS